MPRTDRDAYTRMFAEDGTVLLHPDRPAARYRPLRAVRAFRALMKDKEDTALVFRIFESLPSNSFMERACSDPVRSRGLPAPHRAVAA
jgi:ubiquinone biosynthesis protein COQ4